MTTARRNTGDRGRPRAVFRPGRVFAALLVLAALAGLGYVWWSPGEIVRDGRHDRGTNGIWIQHGWLGDDGWFRAYGKEESRFRDERRIGELATLLRDHGMKYVFPHLCPCEPEGTIPPLDPVQTERFLDEFEGFNVIPWVGGVFEAHCWPGSADWRGRFVASVSELLREHPRLAGVQVNIEPMPDGNVDFLTLLEELSRGIPPNKILSVAAYPPPTWWHRFPSVHWGEAYFRQVARRTDLLAPMMYDTAIRLPKVYRHLMRLWTVEVLEWAEGTPVLLGVPAYDDAGVGYHHRDVENLRHALAGVHAGLRRNGSPPTHYEGLAVYSEWEMEADEWNLLRREFCR